MANKKNEPREYIGEIPVYCSFDKLVEIEAIIPNPLNPNIHDHQQVVLLAKITEKQGWRRPITVSKRSGFIVVGECRYLAALHAGMSKVPVEFQDYASQDEEYADMVADNKLADLSDFDEGALSRLLEEMGNDALSLTGFSEDELSSLLEMFEEDNQKVSQNAEIDTADFNEDKFTHTCPRCGFVFNEKEV